MIELTPDECRVLGVLVEKSLTTPDQYPLSLNSAMLGCNQKNNRDPVVQFDDLQTLDALNALRSRGLVVQVDMAGSRTARYRHEMMAKLSIGKADAAILAELLLRGPQTLGELRGRASRMVTLETLDAVKGFLDLLASRPEPLVKQIPPAPGSRAERYMQLLCPDLHPITGTSDSSDTADSADAPAGASATGGHRPLAQRIEQLETRVRLLEQVLTKLAGALGEPAIAAEITPSADVTATRPAGSE